MSSWLAVRKGREGREGKGGEGRGREDGGRRMRVKYYTGFITPPVRAYSAGFNLCLSYSS